METRSKCAYNVTRNALLSERVWCVDATLGSAELLTLVMNGPGLDRHSAVWVERAPGWTDLPRLFVSDFAYIDERQTIVAVGSAGPGTGFPAAGEEITGALILANRRLAETETVAGDQVKICEQEELAALVKASSQPAIKAGEAFSAMPSSVAAAVPFEVSRYSEFAFEPFGGSLVFIPTAEAPLAQSTEYFLPDAPTAKEPATIEEPIGGEAPEPQLEWIIESTAVESTLAPAKKRKQNKKKPAAPSEEPHFYTPKPIRFFDPATAADDEDANEASQEAEKPGRQSTQLSPELKAAILQIDEQLRRQKEEQGRGKKSHAKEKKKKSQPEEPAVPAGETISEVIATVEEKPAPRVEEIMTAEPEMPAIEANTAAEPEVAAVEEEVAVTEPEFTEPEIIEAAPEIGAGDRGIEEEAAEIVEAEPQENPELEFVEVGGEIVAEANEEEATSSPEPEIEQEPSNIEELPSLIEAAEPEPEPVEEIAVGTSPMARILEDEEISVAAEEIPAAPTEIVLPAQEPESVFASKAAEELIGASPVPQPIADVPPEIVEPEPAPEQKAKPAKTKITLGKRLKKWIGGDGTPNRRRGDRLALPGLVAFYWSGGAPMPHEIVNISKSGFYVRTRDFWLPDTLVRMTLQRQQKAEISKDSITVLARVVRVDEDGVGHEFVTTEALHSVRSHEVLPERGTNKRELEKFLEKL